MKLAVACLIILFLSRWTAEAELDVFTKYTMQRPEGERVYYLYSPTSYTAKPTELPLVLFFHGLTDVCTQFISQFSVFAFVAEKYQVHMGIMCGTVGTAGVGWNAGTCCLFPNSSMPYVDDEQYARTAVKQIQKSVQVEDQQIFSMGHSNGAFMSEALACNASDVFRAVASNAGNTILTPGNQQGLDLCTQNYRKNTTSILLIHGTADTSVPFNGDPSRGFPSVPTDFVTWAKRNGCPSTPVQTFNDGNFANQVYQHCAFDTQIELMTATNGIHMWYLASEFRSSDYALQFFDRVAPRSNKRKFKSV